MIVSQAIALFRQYCDEPDTSFLSDADIQLYLSLGYGTFRDFVTSYDPSIYTTSVDLTFADANTYNLVTGTVKILGLAAGLTDARLMRIVRLVEEDASGVTTQAWTPVQNLDGLVYTPYSFFLEGNILRLSQPHTGTLTLYYVGEQSATLWATGTNYIDDLAQFHQLIVMYAYDHYAIRDAADNKQLVERTKRLEAQLVDYIQRRSFNASDFVTEVVSWR